MKSPSIVRTEFSNHSCISNVMPILVVVRPNAVLKATADRPSSVKMTADGSLARTGNVVRCVGLSWGDETDMGAKKNDRCSVGPFLTLCVCWPRATVLLLLLCARDRNERTFRAVPTHSSRARISNAGRVYITHGHRTSSLALAPAPCHPGGIFYPLLSIYLSYYLFS